MELLGELKLGLLRALPGVDRALVSDLAESMASVWWAFVLGEGNNSDGWRIRRILDDANIPLDPVCRVASAAIAAVAASAASKIRNGVLWTDTEASRYSVPHRVEMGPGPWRSIKMKKRGGGG